MNIHHAQHYPDHAQACTGGKLVQLWARNNTAIIQGSQTTVQPLAGELPSFEIMENSDGDYVLVVQNCSCQQKKLNHLFLISCPAEAYNRSLPSSIPEPSLMDGISGEPP